MSEHVWSSVVTKSQTLPSSIKQIEKEEQNRKEKRQVLSCSLFLSLFLSFFFQNVVRFVMAV